MRGPGVLHIAQYVEIISKCNSTSTLPNGMKSQTLKFFRLLREFQIHQQTKGLILVFYYQFNQVSVLKSEENFSKIQQK